MFSIKQKYEEENLKHSAHWFVFCIKQRNRVSSYVLSEWTKDQTLAMCYLLWITDR